MHPTSTSLLNSPRSVQQKKDLALFSKKLPSWLAWNRVISNFGMAIGQDKTREIYSLMCEQTPLIIILSHVPGDIEHFMYKSIPPVVKWQTVIDDRNK